MSFLGRKKDAQILGEALVDPRGQKIKREKAITLELEPNPDILAELGATKFDRHILIGFAAETENGLENARKKLAKKRVDAIVLNEVSRSNIGFNSDRNAITIVTADQAVEIPAAPKLEIAGRILDVAVSLRKKQPLSV